MKKLFLFFSFALCLHGHAQIDESQAPSLIENADTSPLYPSLDAKKRSTHLIIPTIIIAITNTTAGQLVQLVQWGPLE